MNLTNRSRNILVLLCVSVGAGCALMREWAGGGKPPAPDIVEVRGVESFCNYSPPSWCVSPKEGRPAAILARDGDVFLAPEKEWHVFPYRKSDGKTLMLETKDGVLLLNGEAVALHLSDAGWEWLRKASNDDLAGLRMLSVEKAEALDFALLERLARVRPEIGLSIERIDSPDVAARIVSLFEPQFLSIESDMLSARIDALEPRLARLEILWIGGGGSLDFLPRLPRVHTLLLDNCKPTQAQEISPSRTLRAVTITGCKGLKDLSFLRNLVGLQELNLWHVEVEDISRLAALPELKKLILDTESKSELDLSVVRRLERLTWLGFPKNTTQETFAAVIASHPDLEVVEVSSDKIRDLSPLRSLRNLKAAVVPLQSVDVAVFRELEDLRFLALLHKGDLKGDAAEKMAAVEKALPKTLVVRAAPFCLGSGWILLLIPLIVLLRSFSPRMHERRSVANA